jgi:E3 ubiquitin-protein ligase BIG BROTHER and related proteins
MRFGSVQERAYMMLQMNGGGGMGSDYGSWEAGSYECDDEVEDDYEEESEHHLRVHNHEHPVRDGEGEDAAAAEGSDYEEEFEEDEDGDPEVDPAEFEDDEAYARALQDAEGRDVAARLMALAGLSNCEYKRIVLCQPCSHFGLLLAYIFCLLL